ncbi:MAG: DUF4910 domain-containing protein [Acidobacteria bacterium]|nr:DUF4910 domain-containing protein [Acidobacteriota bacterium]
MKRVLLSLAIVAPSWTTLNASDLIPAAMRAAILEELSGERAYETVTELIRFDRVQASSGIAAAAEHIEERLKASGIEAHIESFPSTKRTWTWYAAPGWEATAATLRMTTPEEKKLADFAELPLSLAKHSNSANVTTDLVDVGAGTDPKDYEGREVAGTIVLATGTDLRRIHKLACVDRGAAGIVNAYSSDVHPGRPDIVRYTAFWPLESERDTTRFCFNVSTSTALDLRARLARGEKIRLEAKVTARFYDSTQPVVIATIPGSGAGEVIFTAHMCHPTPSANDNASGAAGLVEIARTVKKLIDVKRIAQPRRTIRFVWIPEWYGMAPYVWSHPEIKNAVAAFNCDMIGESLAATGGYLSVTRTPYSLPSFLPDLVENTLESMPALDITSPRGSRGRFMYSMDAFTGGSDHIFFNDSTMRVPSLMYSHWPDPFHHTAQDTLDKVDPTELKRTMYAALAPALYVAAAGDTEARAVAIETLGRARARLARQASDAMLRVDAAPDAQSLALACSHALRVVRFGGTREAAAVKSAASLCDAGGTAHSDIDDMAADLSSLARTLEGEVRSFCASTWQRRGWKQAAAKIAGEEDARRLIPARTPEFIGPLDSSYITEKLGESKSPKLGDEASYEMINYIDGRRSAFEIWELLSVELEGVSLADVVADVWLLKEAGLVSLGAVR